MCLSPIKIKNPLYGYGPGDAGSNLYRDKYRPFDEPYMFVPCGHCAECLLSKQQSWIQRCRVLGVNSTMFFATLTYQPSMLPYIDIPMPSGDSKRYYFARRKDLTDCFKRLRRHHPDWKFKFLAVSEYGEQRHRPHFHCLFFFPKMSYFEELNFEQLFYRELFKEWSRVYGPSKKPCYAPLSKLVIRGRNRSYDCHLVTDTRSDAEHPSGQPGRIDKDGIETVSDYVSKYLFKPNRWIERQLDFFRLNRQFYQELGELSLPVIPYVSYPSKESPYCNFLKDDDFWIADVYRALLKPLFFSSNFLGLDCQWLDEPAVKDDSGKVVKPAVHHQGHCRDGCPYLLFDDCPTAKLIRKDIEFSKSNNWPRPFSASFDSSGHGKSMSSYFREHFEETEDLDVYAGRDPRLLHYHPGQEIVPESRIRKAESRLSRRRKALEIDKINEYVTE